MDVSNYQETDGFLENPFKLWPMLKIVKIKFPDYLGHWSHYSETVSPFIFTQVGMMSDEHPE